ncbi:MAG: HpcH/HpaI aldolase/citrate lyase family protein [Halobacteriales archaeon]
MRIRSVLFTPGDRPGMLDGALESEADAVVFDLEDGVADDAKPRARTIVTDAVDDLGDDVDPLVLVRPNPLDDGGADDLDELATADTAGLAGVVLPKVDDTESVRATRGELLDRNLPGRLWCLLETPAGVLAAPSIAEADGVEALIFGGEDYAAAVGARRTAAGDELLVAKQQVVMAAGAAGISAVDGITSAIQDLDRVRSDAERARTFGFDGKLAIHPAQLEPIHEAFAPTEDEIAWAHRVVEVAGGEGGAVRVDDEMIDAPLLKRARLVLEQAGESPEA